MKNIGNILITVFVLTGCKYCETQVNICPTYPKPSKVVLRAIKDTNSTDVNRWMIEQYKLNKKLKVCNEKL